MLDFHFYGIASQINIDTLKLSNFLMFYILDNELVKKNIVY